MKTTRIDQYICLDINKIVAKEMKDILQTDIESFHMQEDIDVWTELQAAATTILEYYE